MSTLAPRFIQLENTIHRLLVTHSVSVLRIVLGATFLGFGLLKFFPDVSPAQALATDTIDTLTFGLIGPSASIYAVATLECFIGICLISGRGMRIAIWLLAIEFVGILSPLVLLPGRLFSGPHHAPTLEGQYVIKDIILVGAGMVIAAGTFRGGRLVRADLKPTAPTPSTGAVDADQKLAVVLKGLTDDSLVEELCERHGISESDFYDWRDISEAGATDALAAETNGRSG